MTAVYYVIVWILLVVCFGLQEFVPALDFAQHAQVLLPPAFFFCSALTVSFPMMLIFALFTGIVWDARHLPYKPEKPKAAEVQEMALGVGAAELRSETGRQLPFGYSVVLFGIFGMLVQGIRPMFKRGRWELPVIMVGIATLSWLLIEYLLMSFLRGSFYFPSVLWTKMVTCALLAMLAAPVLLFVLHTLARLLQFEERTEGLTFRFHGS